jgi:hypothetical protein
MFLYDELHELCTNSGTDSIFLNFVNYLLLRQGL